MAEKEYIEREALKNKLEKPSDDELELINKYTSRQFTSDEVYVFSVVLCDNDIDRDYERFTVEALFELEKLFVGKTGILDHNPSASNKTARIFDCKVEAVAGKKTKTGDDYFRLTARAYMPKSEQNSELILSLKSGIKKEVSISCSVEEILCSICGEKLNACPHIKGEIYGSKVCCAELTNSTDAYEWSFIIVPSTKESVKTTADKKYIEYYALLERIGKITINTDLETKGANKIINEIMKTPDADVQEVIHGNWETIIDSYGYIEGWLHKECGRQVTSKDPYCPNCGAKMDKE